MSTFSRCHHKIPVGIVATLGACALVYPTGAQASCPDPHVDPPHVSSRRAKQIVDAVALSGPESPARFRVLWYEKGSGPDAVRVQTAVFANAIAEGFKPQPGQRYRLYVTGRKSDGTLQTNSCKNTKLSKPGALVAHVGHRKARALRSTYHGHLLGHRNVRRLRVGRHRRLRVRLAKPVRGLSVLSRHGRVVARTTPNLDRGSSRHFVVRLRGSIKRPRTIVFDTGRAFYAVRLIPRRCHR